MPGQRPRDENDERRQYQHQTILTPDRLAMEAIDDETEEDRRFSLDDLKAANRDHPDGKALREELLAALPMKDVTDFSTSEGLLLHRGRLWIPEHENLRTKVIREAHDQPSAGHQGQNRTLDLLRRSYSWPKISDDVDRYIRNCHICKRSKAPRDK